MLCRFEREHEFEHDHTCLKTHVHSNVCISSTVQILPLLATSVVALSPFFAPGVLLFRCWWRDVQYLFFFGRKEVESSQSRSRKKRAGSKPSELQGWQVAAVSNDGGSARHIAVRTYSWAAGVTRTEQTRERSRTPGERPNGAATPGGAPPCQNPRHRSGLALASWLTKARGFL